MAFVSRPDGTDRVDLLGKRLPYPPELPEFPTIVNEFQTLDGATPGQTLRQRSPVDISDGVIRWTVNSVTRTIRDNLEALYRDSDATQVAVSPDDVTLYRCTWLSFKSPRRTESFTRLERYRLEMEWGVDELMAGFDP